MLQKCNLRLGDILIFKSGVVGIYTKVRYHPIYLDYHDIIVCSNYTYYSYGLEKFNSDLTYPGIPSNDVVDVLRPFSKYKRVSINTWHSIHRDDFNKLLKNSISISNCKNFIFLE